MTFPHVPDENAVAAGRLALVYSDLASVTEMLSWYLIDAGDTELGQVVTSGMPDKAKFDLFCALLVKRAGPEQRGAAEVVARQFRQRLNVAEESRNRYLHSHYLWSEGASLAGGPDTRIKIRVKGGGVASTSETFDPSAINALAEEAFGLRNEITKYALDHHADRIPYFRADEESV